MRLSVTCPEDCSNFLGRSKPPPASPSRLCFSSLAHQGDPIMEGRLIRANRRPAENMTFSRTDPYSPIRASRADSGRHPPIPLTFKEQMLELMEGKLGERHAGELHREPAEQRATRIVAEELARRGWRESELATRRRGDPGKPAIVARRRSETTLPI